MGLMMSFAPGRDIHAEPKDLCRCPSGTIRYYIICEVTAWNMKE